MCSPVLWSLPTEIFCVSLECCMMMCPVFWSRRCLTGRSSTLRYLYDTIPCIWQMCSFSWAAVCLQLRQHQNRSIPWPVERWERMRHCRDVVGGRQGLDPDSSSLAGIGCSCKGGLCPSGSWSSCSSKLCWGWKRIGRSVMRFLLFFSQTSRLSLLVFELILPLWVKTKVAVMQTIMQPSCLPLTAI